MASQTIDYAPSPHPRPRSKWPLRLGAAAFLVVVVLALIPAPVSVSQTTSRIDAVTGSMTWQTTGLWRSPASRTDVSPLERRLTKIGASWTPDWRFLHTRHQTAFVTTAGYECGIAPPIYDLRPVLKEFVGASTDAELLAFVRVMQAGTDAEQRAAVDAATDKGLRAMEREYESARSSEP